MHFRSMNYDITNHRIDISRSEQGKCCRKISGFLAILKEMVFILLHKTILGNGMFIIEGVLPTKFAWQQARLCDQRNAFVSDCFIDSDNLHIIRV